MKKILIVEDDANLLSLLAESFAEAKFEVIKAEDGEQGLALALEKKPDLILLDILLPKMDGYAVLEKLKNDKYGKNIPVIISTNLNSLADVSKALELMPEIKGYIVKSDWKIEDVIAKAEEVLAGKSPKIQMPSLMVLLIVSVVLLFSAYFLSKNYSGAISAGLFGAFQIIFPK